MLELIEGLLAGHTTRAEIARWTVARSHGASQTTFEARGHRQSYWVRAAATG